MTTTQNPGVINQPASNGMDPVSAEDELLSRWADDQDDSTESDADETVSDEDDVELEASDEQSDEDSEDDQSEERDPEAEAEEFQFESIEELAEALEMTPEQFLERLKTKAKIDGEEAEITLAELRKGYQREADYTRKTQHLAEQRRALEAAQQQAAQEMQQRLTQLDALTSQAESQLLAEYQAIDWQALRTQDPAEYAARQQDFNARYQQVQAAKQEALNQSQVLQQQYAMQHQQQLAEQVEKERQALTSVVPDWSDEKAEQMASYLLEQGFSPEQVSQVYDHKLILLANKAMQFDQQSKQVKKAKKQVKDLPKVLKPGAKSRMSAKEAQAKKLKQKLKKTGSARAAEELLFDRLGV